MTWPSLIVVSVVGLALTFALGLAAPSRFIRGRLRFSAYLLLAALALDLTSRQGLQEAALLASLARLLVVLATINLAVALLVNPWRVDRASDRFPAIAQDVAIVGMFAVVATLLLRDQILTTSAVGAVIVGFALQDTLGNFFAGLAIQIERPFRVGQWIAVAGKEGQVAEITWRATKLRTEAGQFLIVPNSQVGKEPILNYSEPTVPTRIEVVVGVGYQFPPNVVKAALGEALGQTALALSSPAADVLVHDFGDSAVVYKVRFWIQDYEAHEIARDQLRSAIWYTFGRDGIEIPYPIQVEIGREERPARPPEAVAAAAQRLLGVELFAGLADEERGTLAAECPEKLFARGDRIVRQGAPGASMFVVVSGQVQVLLEPSDREVARIDAGGFFGEMSMLTGEPRTATVRAATDVTALEITADRFRRLALARPALVEQVTMRVADRRLGLDRARDADEEASRSVAQAQQTLLQRIQRFLRLPAS